MTILRRTYFVTSQAYAALTPDDQLAVRALAEAGVTVEPLVWSDRRQRITAPAVLVLRSVWDYHLHSAEFMAWLAHAEAAGHIILNPPPLIRWNVDKKYLHDLAGKGVATIPTLRVGRETPLTLAQAVQQLGASDIVIKPSVSASAFETHRLDVANDPACADTLFRRLHACHDLLVQPYLPAITTEGEWSLIFFDGVFSHSVRKRPASGDFRVQVDFGGRAAPEVAPEFVQRAALAAVQSLPGTPPLFVRIDGVTVDTAFLLMEAECIDPVLFFASESSAPDRFVAALTKAITAA